MHSDITTTQIAQAYNAAKRWREQYGYTGKGGYVILFEGKANGWTSELRLNSGWLAGCIAIPEDEGAVFEAVGGNYVKGATHWEKVTRVEYHPERVQDVCPVQMMADGLQHLALSAALGRSPRQLNIAPPPARPDLHGLLSKASTDARPFTRRD